jgi:hypothetical protein
MYLTIRKNLGQRAVGAGPTASPAKHFRVLPVIAVVLVLSSAGVVLVAIAANAAMKKLRLDLWEVLLWLGLAESPVDELATRRFVRLAVVDDVYGAGTG